MKLLGAVPKIKQFVLAGAVALLAAAPVAHAQFWHGGEGRHDHHGGGLAPEPSFVLLLAAGAGALGAGGYFRKRRKTRSVPKPIQ